MGHRLGDVHKIISFLLENRVARKHIASITFTNTSLPQKCGIYAK
jgi:hypothetical protein